MEFHEKLQELRKRKGLTQEELAEALYVSRTAISKWESGRGFPNIESLKAISRYYSVSLDELLSGAELLAIAEDDHRKNEKHSRDLIFGLLDFGVAMLLFLPFFRQTTEDTIAAVSLLDLVTAQPWLKHTYCVTVFSIVLTGIATLALQNYLNVNWVRYKTTASLLLSAAAVCLFIMGQQPYASLFTFVFLVFKALLLIKQH
jgi:transcriptional regulator with XRE-family HTH domain